MQKQPLTLCQEFIFRDRKSHVKIYEDAWPYDIKKADVLRFAMPLSNVL